MKTFEEVRDMIKPDYDVVEVFACKLEEYAFTLRALTSYAHQKEKDAKDEKALEEALIDYANTVADWMDFLKNEAEGVREEMFRFLDRRGV